MKNQAAQALARKRMEKRPDLHTKEYMSAIARLPRKKKGTKNERPLAEKEPAQVKKKGNMPFTLD